MSTTVWPVLTTRVGETKCEVEAATTAASWAAELRWLVESIHSTTLVSVKDGLAECAELLCPIEPGSTLPLSSVKSESLKGFVTRVGSRLVKGELRVQVPSRTPFREHDTHVFTISTGPTSPVHQLDCVVQLRSLINTGLDVVDVARWAGERTDGRFVAGQLALLHDCVGTAMRILFDGGDSEPFHTYPDDKSRLSSPSRSFDKSRSNPPNWTIGSVDPTVFIPPLPDDISVYFSLHQSALTLTIRQLDLLDDCPDSGSGSGGTAGFLFRTIMAGPQTVLKSLNRTTSIHDLVGLGNKTKASDGNGPRSDHNLHHHEMFESNDRSHRPGHRSTNSKSSGRSRSMPRQMSSPTKTSIPTIQTPTSATRSTHLPLFRGKYARVRDAITVETFDPQLLAVSAKLAHLAATVRAARQNLAVLMDEA